MHDAQIRLWPYGIRSALVAAPLTWLALGGAALWLQPVGRVSLLSARSTLIVIGVGLIPLLLLLFEYIAKSRGVIDIKGVRFDFSQGQITKTVIEVPDNIREFDNQCLSSGQADYPEQRLSPTLCLAVSRHFPRSCRRAEGHTARA